MSTIVIEMMVYNNLPYIFKSNLNCKGACCDMNVLLFRNNVEIGTQIRVQINRLCVNCMQLCNKYLRRRRKNATISSPCIASLRSLLSFQTCHLGCQLHWADPSLPLFKSILDDEFKTVLCVLYDTPHLEQVETFQNLHKVFHERA